MEATNNKNKTDESLAAIKNNSALIENIYSGNLDDVRHLIEEEKVDVNIIMDVYIEGRVYETTPLNVSLFFKKENIAEYLIQHDAKVNVVDKDGNSSLHYAASDCSANILKLLVEHGANVNLKNGVEKIPLHIASEKGNWEAVKYFVDRDPSSVNVRDIYRNTPLIFVTNSENLNIVKYLVEHGADVKVKNVFGETPLHSATYGENLDIVKYLIENGADVNAQNARLRASIHTAAKSGKFHILKYLIEVGGNVNLKDEDRHTALHFAAQSGNLEMVKYLIEEKGLSVEAKSHWNETPLLIAASKGKLNIVKYLIEVKHADINVRNERLRGILHEAVGSLNLELIKYLVEEQNVNINVKDDVDKTPLYYSKQYLRSNITTYLESRMKLRHRRSIPPFQFGVMKPNLIQKLIGSDLNTAKRGVSGNGKTISHLSNSNQPLENSKFLFGVENFAFLGCIAEALNDSISSRYNALRSHGIKVVPSNQIAVNEAREEFDKFVEKKIKKLNDDQRNKILKELEMVGDEINESLMRGVEFSGLHGLEDVLDMCKNCFCENYLHS